MATHTIDKFKYGSDIFVLQDSGALQLTGGSVTGPVNFGDSVTMDEATVGDLVVNGAASFTNNIQVNTINGVNVEFATLMNYKGAKAATSNLPTSGNSQGDVWHVNADGSEWGWNGSAWEELGKAIDLSGYVPTSRTINGKALTGNISLTASDVSALPSNTTYVSTITTTAGAHTAITSKSGAVSFNVPTKTSHLTNDSGFITTDSDEKLKISQASDSTDYYLILGASNTTATTRQYDRTGLKYYRKGGTANGSNGTARLTLGNNIASNTEGWMAGYLSIYGSTAYNIELKSGAPTENRVITLPDASGTIALTSDLSDTNYYHTTGSWNGLTYTATANGGAGALAFTIPTGTTASTVAAGNHTHSDYVPLTSDSVAIKSNVLRIQNKSGNTAQAGSYPYVTSIHIGDGREATIDEYGDGYLGIHGNNGIFLHPATPLIEVYDPSKTYTVGTVVWYDRKYYRCTTAITTAEAWTSGHWTNISASNGNVKVHGDVLPTVTETYSLGSSSLKWNNVYTKTLNGTNVPTSPVFTDENVKQTATTTNSAYEILFSYTADDTTRTEGARKTSTLTYNPSTKALVTGGTIDGYTLAAASAKAVTDSTSASAISTGTSVPTERDIYYGLPTINGAHNYTSSTTIYAPTTAGTSGYYLKSTGSGAPTWDTIPAGVTVTLNGSTTTTPSFYAPTTAGTQGQALISNGSGAPTWGTAGASIQIVRW